MDVKKWTAQPAIAIRAGLFWAELAGISGPGIFKKTYHHWSGPFQDQFRCFEDHTKWRKIKITSTKAGSLSKNVHRYLRDHVTSCIMAIDIILQHFTKRRCLVLEQARLGVLVGNVPVVAVRGLRLNPTSSLVLRIPNFYMGTGALTTANYRKAWCMTELQWKVDGQMKTVNARSS